MNVFTYCKSTTTSKSLGELYKAQGDYIEAFRKEWMLSHFFFKIKLLVNAPYNEFTYAQNICEITDYKAPSFESNFPSGSNKSVEHKQTSTWCRILRSKQTAAERCLSTIFHRQLKHTCETNCSIHSVFMEGIKVCQCRIVWLNTKIKLLNRAGVLKSFALRSSSRRQFELLSFFNAIP